MLAGETPALHNKMSLIFYSEKCIACGQCVEVCPFGVLRLEGETLVIGEGCNLCGACVEVCEVEALALPEGTGPSPRPATPPDGVWVFAEQRGGVLAPVTAELLGEGRRLAEELQVPVAAVLFGETVAHLSPALLAAGAHKVYLAEHPRLQDFLEESYAAALTELARQFRPEIILAGATYAGRAFIPRVAAALKTGLTADCTAFAIDAGAAPAAADPPGLRRQHHGHHHHPPHLPADGHRPARGLQSPPAGGRGRGRGDPDGYRLPGRSRPQPLRRHGGGDQGAGAPGRARRSSWPAAGD